MSTTQHMAIVSPVWDKRDRIQVPFTCLCRVYPYLKKDCYNVYLTVFLNFPHFCGATKPLTYYIILTRTFFLNELLQGPPGKSTIIRLDIIRVKFQAHK